MGGGVGVRAGELHLNPSAHRTTRRACRPCGSAWPTSWSVSGCGSQASCASWWWAGRPAPGEVSACSTAVCCPASVPFSPVAHRMTLPCARAPCPLPFARSSCHCRRLIDFFEGGNGVEVRQCWGMSELSPLGTLGALKVGGRSRRGAGLLRVWGGADGRGQRGGRVKCRRARVGASFPPSAVRLELYLPLPLPPPCPDPPPRRARWGRRRRTPRSACA